MNTMSPYDEGRDARYYDMQISQNPYPRKSDSFESWRLGWADEDRDRKRINGRASND
jgi:hypothetical protein